MSLKHSQLFIATDSVIELKDLVDQDDAPVTDATVEMTALTDADGDAVSGVSLPLAMPHSSGGTYHGALPAGLAVVAGTVYKATVTAVSSGRTATFVETLVARYRAA